MGRYLELRKTLSGFTPLHSAVSHNALKAAAALLQRGASLPRMLEYHYRQRSSRGGFVGTNALHLAAGLGLTDMALLLLQVEVSSLIGEQ